MQILGEQGDGQGTGYGGGHGGRFVSQSGSYAIKIKVTPLVFPQQQQTRLVCERGEESISPVTVTEYSVLPSAELPLSQGRSKTCEPPAATLPKVSKLPSLLLISTSNIFLGNVQGAKLSSTATASLQFPSSHLLQLHIVSFFPYGDFLVPYAILYAEKIFLLIRQNAAFVCVIKEFKNIV